MTPTQPNALEAPHQLQLDSRARLHMTGVIEVESFDESTIVLTTTRGTLIVRGEGLHLQLLRLDGGTPAKLRVMICAVFSLCNLYCRF